MSADPHAEIDEASNKLVHDLRAPAITMRGFSDELADAIMRLVELLDAHQGRLPAEYLIAARQVFECDVAPCLDYLQSSIQKLDSVLDTFKPGSSADFEK